MKKGFTLAEVLITLGVIGVVAALTMSALIAKYQKKETVTRLKKAYSVVQQAIKLSEIENGQVDGWDSTLTGNEFFETYIKDFVKYTKKLTSDELNSVAPRKILNGNDYYGTTFTGANSNSNSIHILLLDGTMVTLNLNSVGEGGLWVAVDVNGLAKPNKIGRDTFLFFFSTKYGLQPFGGDGTGTMWSYGEYSRAQILGTKADACNKTKTGYWCSALIMNDGWEIKDDYPW